MLDSGVNETGFQLLGKLLPIAFLDARAIARRRGAAFAALTIISTALAMLFATPKNAAHVTSLAVLIGAFTLTILVIAEAMRVARPDYKLDTGRVMRLVAYQLSLMAFGVICFLLVLVPFALFKVFAMPHTPPHAWDALPPIVLFLVDALVIARFPFVCFLCEENGMRAFSFSWQLTSGESFLPTLLIAAAYAAPFAILTPVFERLVSFHPSAVVEGARVFVDLTLGAAMASVANPLLMRWMIECERIHPYAYVGFNAADAPDANLA